MVVEKQPPRHCDGKIMYDNVFITEDFGSVDLA